MIGAFAVALWVAAWAIGLILAVRRWLGWVPWSIAVLLFALSFVPLGRAAFTGEIPVPLAAAAQGYPIRGMSDAGPPENPLPNETALQIPSWLLAVRECVADGRAPLWNPYHGCGQPLLGHAQAAPLSPFVLATLPVPLPWQLTAMAVLKTFTALLFGWLLLRREGCGGAAASAGASVFALGLFQSVWLFFPITNVTALLPALLLAIGLAVDRDGPWASIPVAVVTAAMLAGGHPESVAHCAMAAAGFLGLEHLAPRAGRGVGLRGLRTLALGVVLGLGLGAPAWLPFAEQIPSSQRAHRLGAGGELATREMPAAGGWLLLDPWRFGHPAKGDWRFTSNYAEQAPLHLGLVPLALLVATVVLPAGTRRDRLLALAAGMTWLVALRWTPIGDLANHLPGLDLAANARLRFVAGAFVAVAVGRIIGGAQDQGRRGLGLLVLIVAGLALHSALGHSERAFGSWALWGPAVAAAAGLALLLARRLQVTLAILVIAELAPLSWAYHRPADPALWRPELPIVQALRADARETGPFRVGGVGWTLLPDLGTWYGLEQVRTFDPMAPQALTDVLSLVTKPDPRWGTRLIPTDPDALLDGLGVRYLLAAPHVRAAPSWEEVYSGPDGRLLRNPDALARVFVPRSWRSVEGPPPGWLLRTTSSGELALVDSNVALPPRANPLPEDLQISSPSPDLYRIGLVTSDRTLLASSLVRVPGWRLEIDGERATLETVNQAFVGLFVPPGRHHLELRYRPWTWDVGLALALVTGVALVALGRRNRRDS